MNNLPSRIVVGCGLAIVVGGLVTYAVHIASAPVPTAQVAPVPPPPPVVQAPEPPPVPAASAPTAEAPAAVATTEPAPPAPSEPQPASNRKPAKAHDRARATDDTVVAAAPRAAPRVDSANSARDTANSSDAASSDAAKRADVAPPAAEPPAAVAAASASPEPAPAADTAVVDSKITTQVKSILAADAVTKDADLNVNTTQGVVVLSGTLPSQDALDHVKVVAQNVPDVKRVDTSAVKVTSI